MIHAAAQFSLSTVTVSTESVDGSTPGVRVAWNTTAPPQCVASVRVEFRTSSRGPVVANYNTTNTSQTEVIQTGLQCGTNYYITVVVVTGETSDGVHFAVGSRTVQVFVGGKELVCMEELHLCYIMQVVRTILEGKMAGIFVLASQTSNTPTSNIPFMHEYVECPY